MYDVLAKLPLNIESYQLEPYKLTVSGGMERHTTVILLKSKGLVGKGEDVTYETSDQIHFQKAGAQLDLSDVKTLGDFCNKIEKLDLFPEGHPPTQSVYRRYRRWAFESAALDLALQQAEISLARVLNRKPQPVHFVVSQRLGKPSRIDLLQTRIHQYPDLRFKLDLADDWSDELLEELVATHAIDTIDFKSFYKGTVVDIETDPALYKKVLNAFPTAWIEDPEVSDATRFIVEPYAEHVTWDAPLHTAADILAMPFKAKMINVKPSRFGSIQELFRVYDLCEKEGISMYGGGQFELDVGRTHIQYLASLFHPDTPNDVSPIEYHLDRLSEGLPSTVLGAQKDMPGFGEKK